MRQLVQAESVFDILVFLEDFDDSAIIGFEELPKDQDSKNLGLCEIVPTAKIRICWQDLLGGFQCKFRQSQRRFGHSWSLCHFGILSSIDSNLSVYYYLSPRLKPFDESFLQSILNVEL